jgi:hypothetical protein
MEAAAWPGKLVMCMVATQSHVHTLPQTRHRCLQALPVHTNDVKFLLLNSMRKI